MILDATQYHFGVLTSCVHNAWLRVVGGRLKSDYRYGKETVYNTFPWPSPTETQKQRIEVTAEGILTARELFPDSSLADLYDHVAMPPELRKAHRANDAAVLEAYGFPKDITESEIVAELFKMYQKLAK
ncbi:MAG: methylase [Bacteroidales bacterium]|nr:methylase [Bacteroidales bacterium]